MRVESRMRTREDGTHYHDAVLIADAAHEHEILDLLGQREIDEGVFARGTYEVRLSDGYGEHYVLLKGGQ